MKAIVTFCRTELGNTIAQWRVLLPLVGLLALAVLVGLSVAQEINDSEASTMSSTKSTPGIEIVAAGIMEITGMYEGAFPAELLRPGLVVQPAQELQWGEDRAFGVSFELTGLTPGDSMLLQIDYYLPELPHFTIERQVQSGVQDSAYLILEEHYPSGRYLIEFRHGDKLLNSREFTVKP